MNCPACGRILTHKNVEGIEVDACEGGCGGVWFDNFELKKFDEPHEVAGEELTHLRRDPSVVVDHSVKRSCPKCPDVKLRQYYFSVARKAEIDECGGCGGIWVDAGELGLIRETFPSEEARKEAALAHFDELFGEQLAEMKAESAERAARARTVLNVLTIPRWF